MERPQLLVVDDDAATGRLFARIAEAEGYDVRVAASGLDAQTMVADALPVLVILDMVMPDMDGIEMVRWLTEQGYTGGLVLVSGYSETYLQAAAAMARARGVGTVGILEKPVSVVDLRTAIAPDGVISRPDGHGAS